MSQQAIITVGSVFCVIRERHTNQKVINILMICPLSKK